MAGAIAIESYGYMYASTITFTSNTGYYSSGVMYVSTNSYFDMKNSDFKTNKANLTSTIEVLGSSKNYNITISGCTFDSNIAIKNTISLMYSYAIVTNTFFTYNSAK